jgi:ribosome-binding factor A
LRVAVFRDPAGKLRAAHGNPRVPCSNQVAEAQRKRRIEAEIQRVLSEVIAREVKDPRVGNVTITAVNVAADMGTARVYFTPFASINPHEEVRIGLTHAGGFLRGEVGRRLRLRHAPRLEFIFDDTADKASRLTGLIDRAVKDDRAGHVDDTDPASEDESV